MSVAVPIPSHFHCCYLILVPSNSTRGLLQSFPNDLLFTLLSFPWLIFNLASWSILYMVAILIFLKCDCTFFTSDSEAISNDPRLVFEVSFYFPKFASAVPHEPCALARLVLVTNVCICLVCSHCCCFVVKPSYPPLFTHLTPVCPMWISPDLYEALFDIPNPQLHIPHIIPLKSIIHTNYLIWTFAILYFHIGYKLFEE